MPDYRRIYQSQAALYDRLVSKEDHQNNLAEALDRISPLEGKNVVEFGAGTGRLTRLLARKARLVHAFDASVAMIEEGRRRLAELQLRNVWFTIGENAALPAGSASAELTVAGWTFGHCISWYPESWEMKIASAIGEMKRITRRSGRAIILETLGTGAELPAAPNEGLSRYYALLETRFGFARSWIRTDYRFDSKTQADELTRAFFGKTYALKLQQDGSALLPECTGIWHRTF